MNCLNYVKTFCGADLRQILQKPPLTLVNIYNFSALLKKAQSNFVHSSKHPSSRKEKAGKALGLAEYVSEHEPAKASQEDELPEGAAPIRCTMPGSVWKVMVTAGQEVKKGDTVIIEESMKMEFIQQAPCDGYITSVYVSPGDEVHAGQLIAGITKA